MNVNNIMIYKQEIIVGIITLINSNILLNDIVNIIITKTINIQIVLILLKSKCECN